MEITKNRKQWDRAQRWAMWVLTWWLDVDDGDADRTLEGQFCMQAGCYMEALNRQWWGPRPDVPNSAVRKVTVTLEPPVEVTDGKVIV